MIRCGSGKRTRRASSRALDRFLARDAFVVDRHLDQLLAELHRRIQRCHRLLVDHGDRGAANAAQLFRRHGADVAPLEQDLAADDAAVLPHEIHDGERDGRFAATGLAHDAMRLAGHEREIEVDDGRDLSGARVIGDREVAAFEDGGLFAHGHRSSLPRSINRAGSFHASRRQSG